MYTSKDGHRLYRSNFPFLLYFSVLDDNTSTTIRGDWILKGFSRLSLSQSALSHVTTTSGTTVGASGIFTYLSCVTLHGPFPLRCARMRLKMLPEIVPCSGLDPVML